LNLKIKLKNDTNLKAVGNPKRTTEKKNQKVLKCSTKKEPSSHDIALHVTSIEKEPLCAPRGISGQANRVAR
jgi:hypothetical protein